MENKCEDQNFQHSREDITPNFVYASNPPQYPPKQEKCANCWLVRTYKSKSEHWFEYSDGRENTKRYPEYDTFTTSSRISNVTNC